MYSAKSRLPISQVSLRVYSFKTDQVVKAEEMQGRGPVQEDPAEVEGEYMIKAPHSQGLEAHSW